MIYDVPELIARISAVVTLYPGDLIFTGTPSGIGNARSPKRFIRSGDVLTTTIDGIGSLCTRFTADPERDNVMAAKHLADLSTERR